MFYFSEFAMKYPKVALAILVSFIAVFVALWATGAAAAPLVQGIEVPPIDFGTNEAMALLIIGFILSPVTSFIQRVIPPGEWSGEMKAASAFLVCLLAALLLVGARGALNFESLFGTLLLLLAVAIFFYRQFFQPSGIAHAISGT